MQIESQEITEFFKEKKIIGLQFPDFLLFKACEIQKQLAKKYVDIEFIILADCTFGACCVEKIAGEHGACCGIVHFGPACLSRPSDNCVPVLWIFENLELDLANVVDIMQEINTPTLVFYDTCYYHCVESLKKRLSNNNFLVWSTPRTKFTRRVLDFNDNYGETSGRFFIVEDDIKNYSLFYIGKDSLTLCNILVDLNCKSASSFDPETNQVHDQITQAGLVLRRRYALVQKAKDAGTIGIVVGSLGIAKYLDIIESLKVLIQASGKKPYMISVGKPNPAKLGNFLEIDVFVLVACPENSLLDNREFLKPVVTPYELGLALSGKAEWDPTMYQLNLERLFPRILEQIETIENDKRGKNEDSSDEEPEFSLLTGTYVAKKKYSVKMKENSGSLVNVDSKLVAYSETSTAAAFFKTRSFKGLDSSIAAEGEAATLEEGRRGIARGYSDEK